MSRPLRNEEYMPYMREQLINNILRVIGHRANFRKKAIPKSQSHLKDITYFIFLPVSNLRRKH